MQTFDPRTMRLVKVPLEVALIRQMDELIVDGIGGYSDRNDFIRDAISGLILELKYGSDTPAAESSGEALPSEPAAASQISDRGANEGLGLSWPQHHTVTLGKSDATTIDAPLMGLHNRDFPSLWAAAQVAEITSMGLCDLADCVAEVVRRAWRFGQRLASMESASSPRYSALFPTNPDKAAASEANFRAFAIGRVTVNGSVAKSSGPLFQWRLCGVKIDRKKTEIGMLPAADELFHRLDGISVNWPHSPEHATAFLGHIQRYANADFSMMMRVLECVSAEPSRQQLVEQISEYNASWSQEQANSYASGYIARAREWGLIDPKMVSGAYSLTDFGATMLARNKQLTGGFAK